MPTPRIFVSYALVEANHRDYQFVTQLVKDLRAAGADVVTDEVTIGDEDFVERYNEILPTCRWVILIQTPEALRSPQVQMAVNTALKLVAQRRMEGAMSVIAAPCNLKEVPATWMTLPAYDATHDYQRAVQRILIRLGLDRKGILPLPGKQPDVAPSPAFSLPSPPMVDRPIELTNLSRDVAQSTFASPEDRPQGFPPEVPLSGSGQGGSLPPSWSDIPAILPPGSLPHKRLLRLWLALIIVVICVVILAGVVVVSKPGTNGAPATPTVDTQLTALDNYYATATAQTNITATAQVNVTATAQAHATMIAQANATATAVVSADPYPPTYGQLALYDPLSNNGRGYGWEEFPSNGNGESCQFIGNAYRATEPQGFYRPCHAARTTSNFTFDIRMQIIKGSCGGISLRDTTAIANSYYFAVCQDGSYGFYRYDGFTAPVQTLRSGSSAAIITGLNQSNLVAVVANGSNFSLYVNHQRIDSVTDGTYSQGKFGVSADGYTTAVYTNARMWML